MYLIRIILPLILLVFCSFYGKTQTSFRHFIPINTHIGGSLAKLNSVAGNGISQRPGISLAFNSGYMIRYKDRVGISLGGGLILNEYRFSSVGILSSDYYSVAYYAFNVRSGIFAFFPLKRNKHSVLSIALNTGYRFIGNDELKGGLNSLSVKTNTVKQLRPFIEPEIGLSQLKKHIQIDVALTYHLGLIKSSPFNVQLKTPLANSAATAALNYAALIVRFNPEILRKRKVNPPVILQPETPAERVFTEKSEFNHRESRSRYSFKVRKQKLVIKIRDNSEVDGDTLSVYFNNMPVLVRYELKAKPHKLTLNLVPGENTLTLVAHNEGKVPPNTAEFSIRSGLNSKKVTTASGMRYNEVIKINYIP
jgi:hypothetical protein